MLKSLFSKILIATALLSGPALSDDGFIGGFKIYEESLRAKPYAWTKVKSPSPVRAGQISQRFELRDGDCEPDQTMCQIGRIHFELTSNLKLKLGDEKWIALSIYLPKDFDGDKLDTTLFQMHHSGGQTVMNDNGGSQHKLFSIGCFKNDFFVDYRELTGTPEDKKFRDSKIGNCESMKNKWTDLIFHINLEKENGFLEIYSNSKKIFDVRKGQKYQYTTVDDVVVNGIKKTNFINKDVDFFNATYGVYITNAQKYRDKTGNAVPKTVAFYDEIRIGNDRSEVDLKSTTPIDPVD
jgi:Polysaccharide lyase